MKNFNNLLSNIDDDLASLTSLPKKSKEHHNVIYRTKQFAIMTFKAARFVKYCLDPKIYKTTIGKYASLKQNKQRIDKNTYYNLIDNLKSINKIFQINSGVLRRLDSVTYGNTEWREEANKILSDVYGISFKNNGSLTLKKETATTPRQSQQFAKRWFLPDDVVLEFFNNPELVEQYADYNNKLYDRTGVKDILKEFLGIKVKKGKRTMIKKTKNYKVHNTEKPEDTAVFIKNKLDKRTYTKPVQKKIDNSDIPGNDMPENEVRPIIRNDDMLLDIFLGNAILKNLIENNITAKDWDVSLFGNLNTSNRNQLSQWASDNKGKVDSPDDITQANESKIKVKAKLRAPLLAKLYKAYLALDKKFTDDISKRVLNGYTDEKGKFINGFKQRLANHIKLTKDTLADYGINFDDYLK